MKRIPWISLAIVAGGCVTTSEAFYRTATVGAIGCPADEIVLSEYQTRVSSSEHPTWRAECRGKKFLCSHSAVAQCSEELTATNVAPLAPAVPMVPVSPDVPAAPVEVPASEAPPASP